MGLLDDIMADDAAYMVDPDEFGEVVTYVKRDGTTRSINAIVYRELPRDPAELTTPGLVPGLRIAVRNDATYGISGSEYTKGDKVTLSERIGETAKTLAIFPGDTGEGAWHDQGMCYFRTSS